MIRRYLTSIVAAGMVTVGVAVSGASYVYAELRDRGYF